jgi:hypothetical protein
MWQLAPLSPGGARGVGGEWGKKQKKKSSEINNYKITKI